MTPLEAYIWRRVWQSIGAVPREHVPWTPEALKDPWLVTPRQLEAQRVGWRVYVVRTPADALALFGFSL